MQRSIATVSLAGTLPEKLNAIAAAGFDGVEIFDQDLLDSVRTGTTAAEIRQRCDDLGLAILLYQPFRNFEGEPREQFASNMARAQQTFDLMQQLGCRKMLLCSNVSPASSADFAVQVEDLAAIAETARQSGVEIGYEALAWGAHVSLFRDAWARVDAVNSPALGIVLDSFHVLARGDRLGAMAGIPPEKITFVQFADAPWLNMDIQKWSRHFRCFPAQGALPLIEFARELTACGYRGPWSMEIFNDRYSAQPVTLTAKEGFRSLVWLEEQHHSARRSAGPLSSATV